MRAGSSAYFRDVVPNAFQEAPGCPMSDNNGGIGHCRVLVVDDDAMVLRALLLILERQGYTVKGAPSSADALDNAENFHPNIVITDVQLPDRNGVETAVLIRRLVPDCRVLLMSGDTTAGAILAEARGRGIEFDILPKPTEPVKLLAKLEA